jgi:hypothetical protein
MGSVLDVYPAPRRRVITRRLYSRPLSRDEAILGYWTAVGTHLRSAMEAGERECKAAEHGRNACADEHHAGACA